MKIQTVTIVLVCVTVMLLATTASLPAERIVPDETYPGRCEVVIDPGGGGDYPTIQDAVDVLPNGALIELTNGTFTGPGNVDIDFHGIDMTVRSQSSDPTLCIIDCQGSANDPHRAFYFHSGETLASVVSGITITNGYAAIERGPGDGNGGGILCEEGSSPTLEDIIFSFNSAQSGGGGLHNGVQSEPSVEDCVFFSNSAQSGGGGLHNEPNSSGPILYTVFIGNSSQSGGGGLHCEENSIPLIENCTIAYNSAPLAGGIFCENNASPTIMFTIIAFSLEGMAVYCDETSSATMICSDVFGNAGGDWVGCIEGQTDFDGNFSADPCFCDGEEGDVSLCADSFCMPFNHPWGCDELVGALGQGCSACDCIGPVPTEAMSWGGVKYKFR